jgi:small-conductance mechanosensitive channel
MLASVQFVTRPFVVGDRIELKTTGGGSVLVGIVEKITPMRTVLRTDGTIPMAIPNK